MTKNQKAAAEKFDSHKLYSLADACQVVKDITYTKFDASVEISANLGVDPRKANQMIRGVVTLPHGTGKVVRVLALCTPDKENEAKEAGADYVGLDEYIGPMLTLSSAPLQLWPRSVLSVRFSVPADLCLTPRQAP